jgi:tRNA-Thr(GGU) m(6)t(6)A37 methyltransferase TsaA
MNTESDYPLHPVGVVRSPLVSRELAPKQGSEGAPEAWIELRPEYADALLGVVEGDELILLTWLHLGRRDVLRVHPRGDPANPIAGVFATRSPDRPNPIGLHRVRVLEISPPARLRVWPLEAVDGTPVVDIKAVLPGAGEGACP